MIPEVKKKQGGKKSVRTKVRPIVKDHGNDPFFVEKTKESKAFLQKHGFPEELLLKK